MWLNRVLDVLDDPGTAEDFNAKYGMTRKPVIIRCKDGIDARFGWKTAKWNLDYLVSRTLCVLCVRACACVRVRVCVCVTLALAFSLPYPTLLSTDPSVSDAIVATVTG